MRSNYTPNRRHKDDPTNPQSHWNDWSIDRDGNKLESKRHITKDNADKEHNKMNDEMVEYVRLHIDSRDKDCERCMKLNITDKDIEFIIEKVRKYDAFVEKCRSKTNKTDGMFMTK